MYHEITKFYKDKVESTGSIVRTPSFLISKITCHVIYIQIINSFNRNKFAKSGKLFGKLLLVYHNTFFTLYVLEL